MGAKKQPTYRFVVTDARSPRDGRFLEILGHYNPRTEPKTVVVDADKVKAWLAKGAQPSDPVRRLLRPKASSSAVRSQRPNAAQVGEGRKGL